MNRDLEDHIELCREAVGVGIAMVKYGGSFAHHLGLALQRADMENTRLIKATWPELWASYLSMAKYVANEEES